jgi:transcriptional regulator with XRE-family HTH domain
MTPDPRARHTAAAGVPELSPEGPTALRIKLGAQLRRLREAKNITREQAAEAIRATPSKIGRLEQGQSPARRRDLTDLLAFDGLTDLQDRDGLLDLAQQASSPGWWHEFRDVMPAWLGPYVGLEETAPVIRAYEVQFVHGLLQTPDYARAVIRLRHADAPGTELDRRVTLRMRRQQILTRPDPPRLWVVQDEAALRRQIGDPAVMRAQLEHLIQITDNPAVTLQIHPFDAGGHTAAGGPFALLRFADPDLPDQVYVESLGGALYLDKRSEVDAYAAAMDHLCLQAEPRTATRRILQKILAET